MLDFMSKRLGKYSDDDSITSLTEFKVQKHALRHPVCAHMSICHHFDDNLVAIGTSVQDPGSLRELYR